MNTQIRVEINDNDTAINALIFIINKILLNNFIRFFKLVVKQYFNYK